MESINKSDSDKLIFFQSIVDNVPDMIFVKDAKDLRFVLFNKAGEDLLGYPKEEMIGKNDYDFFPKDQAKFFIDKDRSTLDNKKLLEIAEEPINTSKKGVRILHTKKIPILDATGKSIYLLGISEDITDEKIAEKKIEEKNNQLKDNEERLNLVLESARMGAWDLDLINDTAKRNLMHDQIFGYKEPAEKWSTKIFFSHILPEDQPTAKEAFEKAYKTGTLSLECRIIWPDKSIHWIEPRGHVYYEKGKPARMLGTVVDITEKKEIHRKMAEYTENLEMKIKERTKDLADRIEDLEKYNKLMIDRELKMVELKEEIEKFKKKLAGK